MGVVGLAEPGRPANIVPIAKAPPVAGVSSFRVASGPSRALDATVAKGGGRGSFFVEEKETPPGQTLCKCIDCGRAYHWRKMDRLKHECQLDGAKVRTIAVISEAPQLRDHLSEAEADVMIKVRAARGT